MHERVLGGNLKAADENLKKVGEGQLFVRPLFRATTFLGSRVFLGVRVIHLW